MWQRYLIKLMISCCMAIFATNAVANQTPLGVWQTIDDITGKPRAIVEISETAEKTLVGRIMKVFPIPGQVTREYCTACEGERHNQRIVGLTILEKIKRNKDRVDEWNNGEILDPKTGKLYHCNIRVAENGEKLKVRGYIGLPLFGRTQTWLKLKETATT